MLDSWINFSFDSWCPTSGTMQYKKNWWAFQVLATRKALHSKALDVRSKSYHFSSARPKIMFAAEINRGLCEKNCQHHSKRMVGATAPPPPRKDGKWSKNRLQCLLPRLTRKGSNNFSWFLLWLIDNLEVSLTTWSAKQPWWMVSTGNAKVSSSKLTSTRPGPTCLISRHM
jgi:hypothetical protein